MRKIISLITVASMFALQTLPLLASDDVRAQGMEQVKGKMQSAMQSLDTEKPQTAAGEAGQYGDTTFKTLSQVRAKLDTTYYNKTLESDYTKNKIMTMLGQLAITSAYSIGTAMQGQQTQLVSTQAKSLQASSDPNYQAMGQQFSTLATEMAQGNDIEAKQTAAEIQSYAAQNAPVIDPGYKPTQQENALLAGLGSVLANCMSSIMGMLGNAGVQALLTALGCAAGGPIGMVVSVLIQSTIGAVYTGVTNGGTINWAPVANAATSQTTNLAGQGASTIQNGVQTNLNTAVSQITPLPNVNTTGVGVSNSNNSGGQNVLSGAGK